MRKSVKGIFLFFWIFLIFFCFCGKGCFFYREWSRFFFAGAGGRFLRGPSRASGTALREPAGGCAAGARDRNFACPMEDSVWGWWWLVSAPALRLGSGTGMLG